MRIGVDDDISIVESHAIAHQVENGPKQQFDGIQAVVIHIEPVSFEPSP
ncbi:cation transporter dimerization domain-containing protein [Methanomethylovorans sp. PtaU1.Bin093]|nr:cation transporter dimerization domain-containing protein [Methanomethylovorans sp. PtaU1.Bin093]